MSKFKSPLKNRSPKNSQKFGTFLPLPLSWPSLAANRIGKVQIKVWPQHKEAEFKNSVIQSEMKELNHSIGNY